MEQLLVVGFRMCRYRVKQWRLFSFLLLNSYFTTNLSSPYNGYARSRYSVPSSLRSRLAFALFLLRRVASSASTPVLPIWKHRPRAEELLPTVSVPVEEIGNMSSFPHVISLPLQVIIVTTNPLETTSRTLLKRHDRFIFPSDSVLHPEEGFVPAVVQRYSVPYTGDKRSLILIMPPNDEQQNGAPCFHTNDCSNEQASLSILHDSKPNLTVK